MFVRETAFALATRPRNGLLVHDGPDVPGDGGSGRWTTSLPCLMLAFRCSASGWSYFPMALIARLTALRKASLNALLLSTVVLGELELGAEKSAWAASA